MAQVAGPRAGAWVATTRSILAIGIGSFFVLAGAAKVTRSPLAGVPPGVEGFATYLAAAGVPYPLVAAWVVCGAEMACGAGLVIGRWWPAARRGAPLFAGVLAFEMAVAMAVVGVPTTLGRPVLIAGAPVTAEWYRLPLELSLFLALVFLGVSAAYERHR